MTDRPQLSSEEFRRVEQLFNEIADLSPDGRERRLTELDRDEPRIASEVRRLLDYDDEETVGGSAGLAGKLTAGGDSQQLLGETIGPYRLVEVMGEGGMGVVYLAEQDEPVRRRVALKLIKIGMDTRAVVARFEAERQSLALMSHPHIAQVFDAGATGNGRPYFVMEYAPGTTITRYCAERKLDTRARIDLFLDVCDAVQHAHQKGVIHRDLTASNVLVTEVDGRPQVKVIDFGIAKATDARQAQRTLFTEVGQVIGTPEYMSPEQADLSADVDTRTDVYSLGVLLYELLTGRVPFQRDSGERSGVGELLRAIREEEPTRPSTAVRTGTAAGDRPEVAGDLRGDLDWITLRALEKERERRYDSASALADDLRRHLADEPVLAGPPTTGYRLGKSVRRNRVAVIATGMALAALIAGTAGTTLGLLRAREQAEQTRAESAARFEVLEFFTEVMSTADTSTTGGEAPSARDMIDLAAERAREHFGDRAPLTQAIVLDIVGDVYRNMSDFEAARPLLEVSYRLREQQLEPVSSGMWESSLALARLYRDMHETELEREYFERCLSIAEQEFGPDHINTGDCLAGLAFCVWRAGDYELAEQHLTRAYEINATKQPPDVEGMSGTKTNIAILQNAQGKHQEALANAKEGLRLSEEFWGPDSPRTANSHNSLANVLVNVDRYDEAREHYDRAIELWASVVEDHPRIGRAEHNLGYMYQRREQYDEAFEHYERALAIKERRQGPENRALLSTLKGLAATSVELGQPERGLAFADRMVAIAASAWGEYSVELGSALIVRARLLRALDRHAEFERELARAESIAEERGNEKLAAAVAEQREQSPAG